MSRFALPGGFLFVNTGLIRHADSEAELAGVLAHLIAYVAVRPFTRQVSTYSIPLTFIGSWSGYSYKSAVGMAVPLGFVNIYRAAVSAADARGLQCLYEAGYDPAAFVDNLKKLRPAEAKSGNPPAQFSTHPPAAERMEKAEGAIQAMEPRSEYLINTQEFHEVKRLVEALHRQVRRRIDSPPSLRKAYFRRM